MRKIWVPILITIVYLLTYAIFYWTGASTKFLFVLFTIFPILSIWLLITVLRRDIVPKEEELNNEQDFEDFDSYLGI